MALRPTEAEIQAIIDVSSLAAWCQIEATAPINTNNATPAPMSDVQALFAHLQCGPQEHFRSLATLTGEDWKDSTKDIKINGASPSVMLRGKINLFHATARRLSNLDAWPQVVTQGMTPSPATTTGPPQCGGAVIYPQRVNLPTMNIGKVLDQRHGDEITYLSPTRSLP